LVLLDVLDQLAEEVVGSFLLSLLCEEFIADLDDVL
jgi:hypothetical protein